MSLITANGYSAYYDSLANPSSSVLETSNGSTAGIPNVEIVSSGGKCCGQGKTTVRTSSGIPTRAPVNFTSPGSGDITFPEIVLPNRGTAPTPTIGDWISNLFSGKPTAQPQIVSPQLANAVAPSSLLDWREIVKLVIVTLVAGAIVWAIKKYGFNK